MDSGTKIETIIPKQTIAGRNVYLIVTAARGIEHVAEMARELEQQGANLYIFPTPNAQHLLTPLLKFEEKIRRTFNWTGAGKSIPEEDLVIVAPCTFNTFNKLAAGIADDYCTTLAAAAIGKGKRVIVVPAFNKALWDHPQTKLSLNKLQDWGVILIWPEISSQRVAMMDYGKILDRLYVAMAPIRFDSVRVESPELAERLNKARMSYYPIFKEIGEKQEANGTNSWTNGNYSVKVPNSDWMLITRSGSTLGRLRPEDLTLVSRKPNEEVIWTGDLMPSTETPMHLVYYRRTDAQAIIHSHCTKITYAANMGGYRTAHYVRYGKFDTIEPIVPQLLANNGFLILSIVSKIYG